KRVGITGPFWPSIKWRVFQQRAGGREGKLFFFFFKKVRGGETIEVGQEGFLGSNFSPSPVKRTWGESVEEQKSGLHPKK
ncbi:hypothetical protein AMELA_G00172420, partial [Ameiurus melas]